MHMLHATFLLAVLALGTLPAASAIDSGVPKNSVQANVAAERFACISPEEWDLPACKHRLLGISPEEFKTRYHPDLDGFIKCDGGKRRIPISSLNDKYCDCDDGSDEPGTQYCLGGSFYCANVGHVPFYIHSKNVNNGVCDCCDGSDEYDGRVSCPKVCEKRHREYLEEESYKKKRMAEANDIHNRYKNEGSALLLKAANHILEFEKKLEILKEKHDFENSRLQDYEKRENEAKLAESNNPVGQKNVKMIYQALSKIKKSLESFKLQPKTEDESLAFEKSIESALDTVCENEAVKNYIQNDSIEADESNSISQFSASTFLQRINLAFKVIVGSDVSDLGKLTNSIKNQKAIVSSLSSEIEKIKTEVKNQKAILNINVGSNSFLALHGKCFQLKAEKYIYNVCLFTGIRQTGESSGTGLSMGNWKDDKSYNSQLSRAGHFVLDFEDGDYCYNVGSRSTRLYITCDADERVISVAERNICKYEIKMTSPAACGDYNIPSTNAQDLKQHKDKDHDGKKENMEILHAPGFEEL